MIAKNMKVKSAVWLALFAGAVQVTASVIPITIPDNNTTPTWYFGGAGTHGPVGEDNETEHGTIRNQSWDLEAFGVEGNTLTVFGGWDFANGQPGYKPGDLFIKVGGPAPSGDPLGQTTTLVPNSIYGYTYAVLLSSGSGFGSQATVVSLGSESKLDTTMYDYMASNPWKYNIGATGSSLTDIGYRSGLTDAQISSIYGLTLYGGSHNVLSIDLGFLGNVAAGTPVWFSYTMQCGNDSMKGQFDGGFRVPDGGTTLLLLGTGLSALAVLRRKLRLV